MTTRLAPTPSGFLHKGNLFSFMLTWLIARKNNGQILLRIDDLDSSRVRREYIEGIFRSLEWLDLDYDIGPAGVDDFERNFSQTHRLDLYHQKLNELVNQPERTFNCQCSRSQIAAISDDGNYPGTCLGKTITASSETAIRVITPSDRTIEFSDNIMGLQVIHTTDHMRHFVVRQKNGKPAYQVASLTDDEFYGVDTIVRGSDLIYSTAAQLFLSDHLSDLHFQSNHFFHHPLIKHDHLKLSKSQGANRPSPTQGSREKLFTEFAKWVGIDGDPDTLLELKEQFQMDHLKHLSRTTD